MSPSLLADILSYGLSGVLLLILSVNLWSRDRTLRTLLGDVRVELGEARRERDAERQTSEELRLEVGRLRRVVTALIRVVTDAGMPVPDEAYEV